MKATIVQPTDPDVVVMMKLSDARALVNAARRQYNHIDDPEIWKLFLALDDAGIKPEMY